jgi:hypothetical protein
VSSDGTLRSTIVHSSMRRAPSSSSDSGLIATTTCVGSGRTPASKLNVPCAQVKSE